jgi:hypothetical protein
VKERDDRGQKRRTDDAIQVTSLHSRRASTNRLTSGLDVKKNYLKIMKVIVFSTSAQKDKNLQFGSNVRNVSKKRTV